MDELKKLLMDQLDLDDLKGSKAVELVVNFLKDKLPENLHGMLDDLLEGGEGGGALDGLKGLLGGD